MLDEIQAEEPATAGDKSRHDFSLIEGGASLIGDYKRNADVASTAPPLLTRGPLGELLTVDFNVVADVDGKVVMD